MVVSNVEDRQDVGAVKCRCGQCFLRGSRSRSAEYELVKTLNRDDAIEPGIAGAINLTHAARANRRLNLVRAELGTGIESHRVPEVELTSLFLQILTGNIILWHLVRTHFPLVCVASTLDTSDDFGLERIPLLKQFVDALRIRAFEARQAL